MNIRKLLLIHAFITLCAGIILFFSPAAIPGTVGITITPEQYLLCYFIGAGEFSIAYLSYFSAKLKDKKILHFIVSSLIVYHFSTLVFEVYAYVAGIVIATIFFNAALRVIIISLFVYFGFYKTNPDLK